MPPRKATADDEAMGETDAGDKITPEKGTSALRRGKTVEQIYQKKTQLEHILLRPDTYVGSTEFQHQDMFVWDEKQEEIVYRRIDFVPALYKIFDEILVNAADNAMRDPSMDTIEITIDKAEGCISVLNNGKGVPVVMHKEHKCYVPELIFGQLLTSDNYDDNEKKVTGGRNGYGAKLTNVFSTKFIIETADKSVKKKFKCVFENNMSKKGTPEITSFTGKEFTKVTFWPDLARFGMKKLDKDIVGLMMKRAYDVAGSTSPKIKVVLNGTPLHVSNFQSYVNLYLGGDAETVYEQCSDRWEVAISTSENGFSQVSHVNSICTTKGGTHVAHVADQLVEAILKVVKSKNRGGIEIKPQHVKNHLWVFVNCKIENPAFDSQTKETLTTKQSKFGSACYVSQRTMKEVMKSGIVDTILDWAKAKQKVDMGKTLKSGKIVQRVLGIPKLEDANEAGGKNSHECTLILTEGDSAKSLAVAGLSVIGRDRYGVFPLRGKVLNVRDANFKQVTGNAEIQSMLKIVGLDIKREYDSVRGLRYGSIMIMTDQDHDGSHIKGLLINLVHHWWPSLVQLDGFLKEFVTPIVKVWKEGKKDSDRKDEKCFFTLNEYEKWQKRTSGGKGWKSKYYKGLGTSTAKEAKEYFRDIENHEIGFKWHDDEDGESIDLAFNKKRADDRKEWINAYEEGTYVDHSQSQLSYYDFVNKELVQFAKYDTSRSIPSVVDGFKPSQRKVVFASFKKKLKSDIKVAQFVGYVSEQAAYHHGEASLENTIIGLAQNFVGSNNVNLLFPSGQFGTRLQGGKDHAASRYIYTRMTPAMRLIFPQDDDKVLNYLKDEGQSIEPSWYCPILPMVLVNGADGIGTGWSTAVPTYNPREIIRNIRNMLRGEQMEDMVPWYKGYTGTVVRNEKEGQEGKFEVTGVIEKKSGTMLVITELPIRTWTQNYKEFLEELMPGEEKKKQEEQGDATITDFREYHTENTVHFEVTMSAEQMQRAEKAGLEKTFRMKTSVAISNMVLFDAEGKINKYSTALEILKDFCNLRRTVYVSRKAYLVAKLTRDKEILSNKARFILMVVNGELELRKKKKAVILQELLKKGFKKMSELDAILEGKSPDDQQDAPAAASGGDDAEKTDYDYLLGMALWSLTLEKVEELSAQRDLRAQELDELNKTTVETMWDRDLEALMKGLDEMDSIEAEEAAAANEAQNGRRQKVSQRKAAQAAKSLRPTAPRSKTKVWDEFAAMDKKMLKMPLQEGAVADAVQKFSWGTGAPLVRKTTEPPAPPRGEEPLAPPLAKAPRRSSTTPNLEPPPPMERPESKDAAQLLSRLMSRSSGEASQTPSLSAQASSSPSKLGGREDVFSYLKAGQAAPQSTPSSAPPQVGDKQQLKAGQRMKLKGLQNAPEMNGQTVTLVDYIYEKGRWNVKKLDGSSVGVSPANLEPLDAGSSSSAPTGGGGAAAVGSATSAPSSGLPLPQAEDAPAPVASVEKLEHWLKAANEKGTLEKAGRYLLAIARKGGVVKGFRIEEPAVITAFEIVGEGKDAQLDTGEPPGGGGNTGSTPSEAAKELKRGRASTGKDDGGDEKRKKELKYTDAD